jgi:peptidoglycan/LPS O-acetylase OafA/YrhL
MVALPTNVSAGRETGMAAEKSRNISIDVLRAVAILTVIALHWVNSRLAATSASAIDDVFVKLAGHGTYGVTLFFVLSGYLITRTTMLREPELFALSARDFYVRRIARIQPLFVAVVLLGLVMIWIGDAAAPIFQYTFRDPKAVFGGEFLASLFTFTYNWEMILHRDAFMFRGVHWDVMWSLAVEEQFYLAFPLLFLWTKNQRRLIRALCGVVVLGIAARVICDILHAGLSVRLFNSFVCFDTLALGVLCALLGDRLPHGRRLCLAAQAAGAALIALALYRGGVAPLIVGALLFVHGARYADVLARWAALARIGQLSYGLYLLHATVLYLASPYITGMNVLTGYLVVVALTYGLAEVVWRLYEAPMNAWIRTRLLRRRPAAALAAAP